MNLDQLTPWSPADEAAWQAMTVRRRVHVANQTADIRKLIREAAPSVPPADVGKIAVALARNAGPVCKALAPFTKAD